MDFPFSSQVNLVPPPLPTSFLDRSITLQKEPFSKRFVFDRRFGLLCLMEHLSDLPSCSNFPRIIFFRIA